MADIKQTEHPVEFHWSADTLQQMLERYEAHIKYAEELLEALNHLDARGSQRAAVAAQAHATLALALRPR